MMKEILIINGSPKRNGITSAVLKELLDGMDLSCANVSFVNCYDKKISACIDCGFCKKVCGKCSIEDDMTDVYEKIRKSHVIILASPMYFGMFPGTLKCLIDRCQMFWAEKAVFDITDDRQKSGFLLLCAGSSWSNMFEPMDTVARYFLNTVNCKVKGRLYIENTDSSRDAYLMHNDEIIRCRNIINNVLMADD